MPGSKNYARVDLLKGGHNLIYSSTFHIPYIAARINVTSDISTSERSSKVTNVVSELFGKVNATLKEEFRRILAEKLCTLLS